MTLGHQLSTAIEEHVRQVLDAHKSGVPIPEPIDFFTDNIGEVIERLAIEHIRGWHCEDAIGEAVRAGDDAALVAAKKKLETCWKVRRPRLVSALNHMINDAVVHGKSLVEDSVKIYKGYEDDKSNGG